MGYSTATERFQKLASMIKDAVFLATLIVAILSTVGSFGISMVWPHFVAKLRQDLNVATRDDLMRFQRQLNQLTGEDRITRMPSGHSFVAEPVRKGDIIDLTLVLARTDYGAKCNYVMGTPLFIDSRDVPFAGDPIQPIKQLSTNLERLRLRLTPPEVLEPGRIGVTISMKFSCPFGPGGSYIDSFDETDIVFFQMDSALN